jgi:hypothetical protein
MGMLNINATRSTSAPDGPFCAACGGRTRLVGIEAHPRIPRTDLHTYECTGCDSTLVVAAPHRNASVNALVVMNPQA